MWYIHSKRYYRAVKNALDHGMCSKPFTAIVSWGGFMEGMVSLLFPPESFGNVVLLCISFGNLKKKKIHYLMWEKG